MALEQAIIDASRFVHENITNPPGGANIGEWCKKEKCWDRIKENADDFTAGIQGELISVSYDIAKKDTPVSSIHSATEEERALINAACEITATTWFSLSRWAKETNNLAAWQRSIVFAVGTIIGRGKKPSYKQANQAIKALKEAERLGFSVST